MEKILNYQNSAILINIKFNKFVNTDFIESAGEKKIQASTLELK